MSFKDNLARLQEHKRWQHTGEQDAEGYPVLRPVAEHEGPHDKCAECDESFEHYMADTYLGTKGVILSLVAMVIFLAFVVVVLILKFPPPH